MVGNIIFGMSTNYRRIIDVDLLRGLIGETVSIEYDESGNIAKIVKVTKDSKGNKVTVTFTFQYDDQGNLSNINKSIG